MRPKNAKLYRCIFWWDAAVKENQFPGLGGRSVLEEGVPGPAGRGGPAGGRPAGSAAGDIWGWGLLTACLYPMIYLPAKVALTNARIVKVTNNRS